MQNKVKTPLHELEIKGRVIKMDDIKINAKFGDLEIKNTKYVMSNDRSCSRYDDMSKAKYVLSYGEINVSKRITRVYFPVSIGMNGILTLI